MFFASILLYFPDDLRKLRVINQVGRIYMGSGNLSALFLL